MRHKADRRDFLKIAAAATFVVPAGAWPLRALAQMHENAEENKFAAPDIQKAGDSEFPRRTLIEAPYENSLDARYVSKPVLDSAMVDDMETDRPWTVFGIGKMAYTTERARDGKRSLRFQTSLRDEDHLRAFQKNGSFTGDQGGFTGMRLNFVSPQDWSRFNRISLWVYVHPTSMHAYSIQLNFDCEGAPKGTLDPVASNVVQNLKAGEWNRVVWEIPEIKRDRVTSFTLSQTLTGHGPEDKGIVTYDFDQISIDRVDTEPYEGWQVAPEKIAFQHVGYRPSEQKLAFAGSAAGSQFELVDAVSGKSAASFPVSDVSNPRGQFKVLDFSAFNKPGKYYLRSGHATGKPFAISDDIWFYVIEKALNFYYGQRCGFDVPGVHHVCHKDWQGTHNGQTKIINGGWHDAGDLSQGSFRTGGATYSMLQIYDQLQQKGIRPELQSRMLEEAKWGLDWLLKTRFGDGYRITWARMRYWTDNKVGTVDDVIVPAQNIAYENFLFSSVGAYASRILKTTDPLRAAASLKASEEDYEATLQQHPDRSEATRDEAAFGALASVDLYRATGKQIYSEQAARFGSLLIQCQEQRFVDGIPITGYFYTSTKRDRLVHERHSSFEEAPLMALRALCDTFPNHPDWMQWYGAALLHSKYFQEQGTAISAPFRLIPNSVWRRSELDSLPARNPEDSLLQFNAGTHLAKDYSLRVFPIWTDNLFHGNTAVHMAGTAAMASAALLRNSRETQDRVRLQLQWVLGGNPFSQSLMYGEGYDYQPLFAYCSRDLTGALPVGMDSRNDSPYWPAENRATYKEMWVVPVSRMLFSLASMAMPAQVSGVATTATELRETRTGAIVRLAPGKFIRTLPPGEYTISSGKTMSHLSLLAGGHYEIPDPRRPIDMALTAKRPVNGEVQIEARLTGSGSHKVELRAFNGTADISSSTVTLTPGREHTVVWKLRVNTEDKPWVIVAIPDNNMTAQQELSGTMRELPQIE
jgi:hypothetical protein